MKDIVLVLVLTLLSLLGIGSAYYNYTDCSEEFHAVLEKAVEIKNHCNIRGYYDCCEAQAAGKLAHLYNSATGIYDLNNVCSTDEDDNEGSESLQPPMRVVCDMDTDEGGWIVIMRRKRSVVTNVNFYNQLWDHYENGFGNLNTEFWLGLRNIYCLTTRDDVDLMIDLHENTVNGITWIYHKFKVSGSSDKYRLQISEAEGPPGGCI